MAKFITAGQRNNQHKGENAVAPVQYDEATLLSIWNGIVCSGTPGDGSDAACTPQNIAHQKASEGTVDSVQGEL